MKNKILIASLIFAMILVAGCSSQSGPQGTLVMKLTDAPAGLNIQKADVVISKVQVHLASANEAENAETESNWLTVVDSPQTFDLVQLKNVKTLLGSKNLSVGKYTQVRLTVDSAKVTIDGKENDLTIPSKTIKLVKGFNIEANKTITLTLDFNAEESINDAGGKYIMKPTIKVIQE